MTLFTKFGNWFLRNSRNIFLILIVNYLVSVQLGYNVVGGLMKYFFTGEFGYALSRFHPLMIFHWESISRRFVAPTILVVIVMLYITINVWFATCLIRWKQLWVNWKAAFYLNRASFWLVVLVPWMLFPVWYSYSWTSFYKKILSTYQRGVATEEASMLLTTFFFWLLIDKLYQSKFETQGKGKV